MTRAFVSGLELSGRFYGEAVRPVLDAWFTCVPPPPGARFRAGAERAVLRRSGPACAGCVVPRLAAQCGASRPGLGGAGLRRRDVRGPPRGGACAAAPGGR